MARKKKLHLLLIGHVTDHPSGSSLLFQQLVDKLQNYDYVDLRIINTARPPQLTSNIIVNAAVAMQVTLQVMRYIFWADVVTFHASRPAMMSYGPILFLLSRTFRRPLVLRLFGGTLEKEYEALSYYKKLIFVKTILSSELLLLETKHLVSYFDNIGAKCIKWYSNSRELIQLPFDQENSISGCNRFVFLGRVIEEKGIGVILETVSHLTAGITVNIFGPLDGHYTAEQINSIGKGVVYYKGVLTSNQVSVELFNYHALILPTFYQGEGYPGVILEAYSHGLPVIATLWRSIPEIVDENSGVLIPVRSPEALAQAMNHLHADMALYGRLKKGAFKKRLEFSDQFWADRFLEWCIELANVALCTSR